MQDYPKINNKTLIQTTHFSMQEIKKAATLMALESFLVPVSFRKRVTQQLEMEQANRGFISLSVMDVSCLTDLTLHKPVHLPELKKKKSKDKEGRCKSSA